MKQREEELTVSDVGVTLCLSYTPPALLSSNPISALVSRAFQDTLMKYVLSLLFTANEETTRT
jgi:hypothetical protein